MTSLKQNIRSVLSEVEKFLAETLKSVKLSSSAKDEKDRVLGKVRDLLDEISGSASNQFDNSFPSGGSHKISSGGDSGSASGSIGNAKDAGDDEVSYSDDIAKVAASDLKNKLQAGLLEKKKKSVGFKSWEQMYCVVSSNIFYIYKKQGDAKQKEAFCLSGYEFHEAPALDKDASKKEMCFELTKTGAPSYQFRAASKEGMVHWREAITKGIQMGPEDDEEPGEMYDYLDPIADPHSYINVDDHQYDNYPDMPTTRAPPVPSNPPPSKTTTAQTGSYQNLPQGKTPAKQQSPRSLGAPPPMIDLTKECSTGDEPVVASSVKDTLKRLNQNVESKPGMEKAAVKSDAAKSPRRGSTPDYANQKGTPAAVEIYDDCTELPPTKKTPGKSATLPGANRGCELPPPPTSGAANPRGRELPPPPTSATDNARPKSEVAGSKAATLKPITEKEQLPPPDSVKNLKKLFQ